MGQEKMFTIVSVDKQNGKRPAAVANYGVTEVPTIIVNGKKYSGQESFKWLKSAIKNIRHSVPSQDTRMNKNVVSGYNQDTNNFSLSETVESFEGNSSYASLGYVSNIQTPDEGVEVGKSEFVLPDDSLTGERPGYVPQDPKKKDKTSAAEVAFERLQREREKEDAMLRRGAPRI